MRASDPTSGLNFLFRDFGIVRVRSVKKSPLDALRDNNQAFSGDEDQLSAVEEDMNQTKQQQQAEEDFALEEPSAPSFENHYALFSFYDDY